MSSSIQRKFVLKFAISILENAGNKLIPAILEEFAKNPDLFTLILCEKMSNDLRLTIAKWVVEKIIPAPVEEEPAEEEPVEEEPVEKIIPAPSEEESDEEKPVEEEPVEKIIPAPYEEEPDEEVPDKEEPDKEEPVEKIIPAPYEEEPDEKEPDKEEPDKEGFTIVSARSQKSTRSKAQAQAPPSYRTPRHSGCMKCGGSVQVYNGEPNSYCSGCYNGMKPDCKRNGCKNKCNSYTDHYGDLCYNPTCKECWEDRPRCKECKKVQVAFDPYREKFNPLCGDCHSVTNKY
jgi:hypothetical protein